MDEMTALFGDPISKYTRAQAIENGVLVDLTHWARETGYVWHIAVTRAVYAILEPPAKSMGQDLRGRAHDLLWMLFAAIRGNRTGQSVLTFRVLFAMPRRLKLGRLKSVCGPDDDGQPCLTVMLPDED